MKVANKVLVVTGGGSGIGRALVTELLERGATVAAVDLSEEGLDETARRCDAGSRLSVHTCDISDKQGVAALPALVEEAHGAIDGLINNAGVIQPFTNFVDLDDAVIDRMVRVNLYGTLYMCRAFLPRLLERPEAHLVNVSSMGGFMPFPGQTMYGVAKAGVKLLTEGLYAEHADTAVDFSVVMPGAVATNIMENSRVDTGTQPDEAASSAMKPLPASDAAKIIVDGMERAKLHILVGRDAQMLSLVSRIAPGASIRFVQRQMKKALEH